MMISVSEMASRLEADRRAWASLSGRELRLIQNGLTSERNNPEADVRFVDERIRIVSKELGKRKV